MGIDVARAGGHSVSQVPYRTHSQLQAMRERRHESTSHLHFLGNGIADIAAGLDEAEAAIGWGTSETITIIDGMALKVMKRLTAVAQRVAEDKRATRPGKRSKLSRPDIAALRSASQHMLVNEGRNYNK